MPAEQTGLVKENYLWKVNSSFLFTVNHVSMATI